VSITGWLLNTPSFFQADYGSTPNQYAGIAHSNDDIWAHDTQQLFKWDKNSKTFKPTRTRLPGKIKQLVSYYQSPYILLENNIILCQCPNSGKWTRLAVIPTADEVMGLSSHPKTAQLLAYTDSAVWAKNGKKWTQISKLENSRDLHKFIYNLHTGAIFYPLLPKIYNLAALGVVILTISGLFIWIVPLIKRKRR
jgi:hypothetical protein